ncbi:UDP-2,4-diacetamido-2,4,6-trideoxy-beta-L-altropyranose hydrolase [Chitinibacter sp. FCG-7]|uniref:UDP-2,4-diacetamido-2,4, 6-trideoxy-beta-L-altropyranose hydrolase n=1 Tax=Chitinibacter mangrovi TaxID=3153927 RepID=A0AAU7FAU9_9NEIS
MRILFRVDASLAIGVGHVSRCLTLANRLIKDGAEVFFACRNIEGHQRSEIIQNGFQTFLFDCDQDIDQICYNQVADFQAMVLALGDNLAFDWVVVDHYRLDAAWEQLASGIAKRILVIDDLADRDHVSDFLLDQNYFIDAQSRYKKLTPFWCRKFIGEQYVLLREEFFQIGLVRDKVPEKKRVLVSFGGTDPQNLTIKILQLLAIHFNHLQVDVLLSSKNPDKCAIEALCQNHANFQLYVDEKNVAALMAQADVALGAGGITTYERIFMQLPSIVVAVADNQYLPLLQMSEANTLHFLGRSEELMESNWLAALKSWFAGELGPLEFLPVAERTAHMADSMGIELLNFGIEHIEKTFTFIQDPLVQSQFVVRTPFDLRVHNLYWDSKLKSGKEYIFAIHHHACHIGNCGLKKMDASDDYEAWIYIGDLNARNRGLGETAFCFLLRYAFVNMKLPILYLSVLDDNLKAIALYQKFGFVRVQSGGRPSAWSESQRQVSTWALTV